jgi:pilus assembly protein Flp/PilA
METRLMTIIKSARQLLKDDGGATAIEYALIAAGVAAAIVVAVSGLGTNVAAMWTRVSTALR